MHHTFQCSLHIKLLDLILGEQSLFDEGIEVDHVRVARVGREALVGAVAVAGRSDGQDLPEGLACLLQKISEFSGVFADRAYAVGRGQRGDRHEHTGNSCHIFNSCLY